MNAPDFIPEKKYSMLYARTVEHSHQRSSLVIIDEVFQEKFRLENFSVWQRNKDYGYITGQDELKGKIGSFDIFIYYCSKPVFDFNFFRELKQINPRLIIVHVDGDAHINFPTYSELLLEDIDLFVSYDSIDTADFVAQMGHRAICLGSHVSSRDFFPIEGIKKDINVSFYGGLKGDRKDFLQFLSDKDVGLQCFGKSFGRLAQDELNTIINRTKIGLSFNKHNASTDKIRVPAGFNLSRQLKGHIFEYALCKTFVLSEHVDNSDRFFVPGKELVSFEGKTDLLDKIRFYLEHDDERETIAQAAYDKTITHIEGALQARKMANLIIKCVNAKRGHPEMFTSDTVQYNLKPLSAQGNYRPTKQHFVNVQTSIAVRLWRKGRYVAALQQLRCLKYGLPLLYLRSQLKFYVFGKLGLAKRWLLSFRSWAPRTRRV